MKLITYNIKGLGGRVKKREAKQMVKSEKLNLIYLQETKMEVVDRSLCARLWDMEMSLILCPS